MDCTLTTQIPAPRVLEQSNESRILSIEPDVVRSPGRGTTVSVDFEHGIPVQPHERVIEVGVASRWEDGALTGQRVG